MNWWNKAWRAHLPWFSTVSTDSLMVCVQRTILLRGIKRVDTACE